MLFYGFESAGEAVGVLFAERVEMQAGDAVERVRVFGKSCLEGLL